MAGPSRASLSRGCGAVRTLARTEAMLVQKKQSSEQLCSFGARGLSTATIRLRHCSCVAQRAAPPVAPARCSFSPRWNGPTLSIQLLPTHCFLYATPSAEPRRHPPPDQAVPPAHATGITLVVLVIPSNTSAPSTGTNCAVTSLIASCAAMPPTSAPTQCSSAAPNRTTSAR